MYAHWILTALIAWPAVAALAVLMAPPRVAKHLALAASLAELALSVPLWWTFVPSGGMQFQLDAPWIPAWGIHYTVGVDRSEEHTSELQSRGHLVCRLLLEKKKTEDQTSYLRSRK